MKDLFHISFRDNLEGIWSPRLPDGKPGKKALYPEPDYPRISLSPSFEKCFWGVWPNVKKYFIKDQYPYMVFSVYRPVLSSSVKIVDNKKIVKDRLVHDAHITEEHFIVSDVEMERICTIKVMNCLKNKEILYRPYDDPSLPEEPLCFDTDIEILEVFGDNKKFALNSKRY